MSILFFLQFKHPFVLAHGTRTGTQLAFVKITSEGVTACGEASLPPYLNETVDSVTNWIENQNTEQLKKLLADPFSKRDDIPYSPKNSAASAALQSAILNWYVKTKNKKLSDYFPSSHHSPSLTLTMTKSDFNFLEEKLEMASNFTHLKLKLTGESDDLDYVKSIRLHSKLPFCVDANQGYNNKEDALKLINSLEKLDVHLVEQPLKFFDHEGHFWLKQRSSIPIIADESIRSFEDLIQFHEAYNGVNVKPMKCGGLFQAEKMLQFVPSTPSDNQYLKLLGCMSESTLGVSTTAVLASQSDISDLDAPFLIKNDPFHGFDIKNGVILLHDSAELNDPNLFKEQQ